MSRRSSKLAEHERRERTMAKRERRQARRDRKREAHNGGRLPDQPQGADQSNLVLRESWNQQTEQERGSHREPNSD